MFSKNLLLTVAKVLGATGLLMSPLFASAHTINFSNNATGPSSSNTHSVGINTTSTFTSLPTATHVTNFTANGNTGGNVVAGNTIAGSLSTGTIGGSFSSFTHQNGSSLVPMLPTLSNHSITGSNTLTGPNSSNSTSVGITENTSVLNVSNATSVSNVNLSGNTGNNVVSGNTSAGSLSSGGINFNLSETTVQN